MGLMCRQTRPRQSVCRLSVLRLLVGEHQLQLRLYELLFSLARARAESLALAAGMLPCKLAVSRLSVAGLSVHGWTVYRRGSSGGGEERLPGRGAGRSDG